MSIYNLKGGGRERERKSWGYSSVIECPGLNSQYQKREGFSLVAQNVD